MVIQGLNVTCLIEELFFALCIEFKSGYLIETSQETGRVERRIRHLVRLEKVFVNAEQVITRLL